MTSTIKNPETAMMTVLTAQRDMLDAIADLVQHTKHGAMWDIKAKRLRRAARFIETQHGIGPRES